MIRKQNRNASRCRRVDTLLGTASGVSIGHLNGRWDALMREPVMPLAAKLRGVMLMIHHADYGKGKQHEKVENIC